MSFLPQKTYSPIVRSAEFRRIVSLPRREPNLNIDLSDRFLKRTNCTGCALCKDGPPKLRPIQSAALYDAEKNGGLFAPIGVGFGKELICLLLPAAMGAKNAVILTKPRLKDQMLNYDIPRYSKHFDIPLDRITVVSYSTLSTARTADILEQINPDVVIANECHELKHYGKTAKTKRFRHFADNHLDCRYAFLSGTVASHSIRDYVSLLRLALRQNCPLPFGYRELLSWSDSLDVLEYNNKPGPLLELCGPYIPNGDDPTTAARKVYRKRLVETSGVVATSENSLGCSLVITALKDSNILPIEVVNALKDLRNHWAIEDEEFQDATEVAEKAKQLACGFYYRWKWPGGVKDKEWLEARSNWYREVRQILQYRSRPGLDSPLLVTNAAERGEIKVQYLEAWKKVKDRPAPPQETVWLTKIFIDKIMEWTDNCSKEEPGIVWIKHKAVVNALKLRGLEVYGAGIEGDGIIQSRSRVIGASMVHKDGKNLQHFCRNLVLTPPSDGQEWEQLIGRTMRAGQKADEIQVDVFQHDESLQGAFQTALNRAMFLEHTQGPQKLLFATKLGF